MINNSQQFDVAYKFWLVASNPNAAKFAYERLAVCRSAAEVQMNRILDAAKISRSTLPQPAPGIPFSNHQTYVAASKECMIPLIYETHYYFVAWANCGNMLRVLTGQPEFLESKKVFDSYRKHFEQYTAARNSFEHFHDRLPGNRDEKSVREIIQGEGAGPSRIYFGFSGGQYRHSNLSWDITPDSLKLLNKAIDEILAALHRQVEELFNAKFAPRVMGNCP